MRGRRDYRPQWVLASPERWRSPERLWFPFGQPPCHDKVFFVGGLLGTIVPVYSCLPGGPLHDSMGFWSPSALNVGGQFPEMLSYRATGEPTLNADRIHLRNGPRIFTGGRQAVRHQAVFRTALRTIARMALRSSAERNDQASTTIESPGSMPFWIASNSVAWRASFGASVVPVLGAFLGEL